MGAMVLIASDSTEGSIVACDLLTGAQVTSYKGNASPKKGMCTLGQDYFMAAQVHKHALNIWSWNREQVLQRSFVAEAITALSASPDGSIVAGGGASGTLYLWETSSGRLLRAWAAHYKNTTALLFVGGPSILISSGEDTLVYAWSLPDLLDPALEPASPAFTRPPPLHAWSDHTLPVTSLASGVGEAAAVVATASLDRTVKLRRLSDGLLLRTVALPAAVNDLAMDAGEQWLYAAGGDGNIYQVPFLADWSTAHGSSRNPSASEGTPTSSSSGSSVYPAFLGHSRPVTCLALAPYRPGSDGHAGGGSNDCVLVSGSEDGTVRVWDMHSRQPVQAITAPGRAAVSNVQVVTVGRTSMPGSSGTSSAAKESKAQTPTGGGASCGTRIGARRAQPLAPFSKHPGIGGAMKRWEGVPVVVDGTAPFTACASSTAAHLGVPRHAVCSEHSCAWIQGAYSIGSTHDAWEVVLS